MYHHQIITLTCLKGVGKASIRTILDYIHKNDIEGLDREQDYVNVLTEVSKHKSMRVPEISQVNSAMRRSDEIMQKARQLGVGIITSMDKGYPMTLTDIADRPSVLFYKGNTSLMSSHETVGLAGTRKPSATGLQYGKVLIDILLSHGIVTVSGLAMGMDTLVHQRSLDNNSPTIGCLPSGFDQIYPCGNKRLSEKIVENDGLLLSEKLLGSPYKNDFIDRNRIIAGLSEGVIILEAKEKSGSMHTASFAVKYQKTLAAMAPPDTANFDTGESFQGNEALIKAGHLSLASANDVESLIRLMVDILSGLKTQRFPLAHNALCGA